MIDIHPSTRAFLYSQATDMRYSFDALSGLVKSYFGLNPICGHIFVFFNRRRDRMKVLVWQINGFVLYYKRLEQGTFSWVLDLNLHEGGEMDVSDFAMILTGINPCETESRNRKKKSVPPKVPPLQLV